VVPLLGIVLFALAGRAYLLQEVRRMHVQELVGSEVLVGYGRERPGRIVAVTKAVELGRIVDSANSSFFLVRLESGHFVEPPGLDIFFRHPAFVAEDARSCFP
jgi:hypothetical protein